MLLCLCISLCRLGNVLHIVQSSSPILSEADSEWATEVKDIQQKVLHMKRYSEGVSDSYFCTVAA